MQCGNCGSQLKPGAKFCSVCGTPAGAGQPVEYEKREENQESYRPGRDVQRSQNTGYDNGYQPEPYKPAKRDTSAEVYVPKKQKQPPRDEFGFGSGGSSEMSSSDTKTIRKYFLSQAVLPVILIVLGICTLMMGIGIIFIILGIVLLFRSNYAGEDVVDRAWDRQKKILEKRGLQKLNMIQEQVSLIDPVVLVGVGASPDSSFDAARQATIKKGSSFLGFLSLFRKKKANGTEEDPVESLRIGSDDYVRSMLQEVNVYVFTETQVLMYSADADISTGQIYREMTSECFYQDIEAMNFTQSVYKVFHPKKKKYMNKIAEKFTLYMGGCKFSANVSTELNNSVMDNQFTAMRNLIRDKKNA